MPVVLVVLLTMAAEPTAEQTELLKRFRSEFVAVTPGQGQFPRTILVGNREGSAAEQPVREISLNYSFAIAQYEVPQNLWEAVMGSNPSKWKGPRNSCEMLTFDEARQFGQRATELMRSAGLIAADEVVRLPSEVEWEYCARAGSQTAYSFGDDAAQLGDYGWFTGNAAGNDPPVGAKKPNGWGLYDVHGYLWEWCLDTWHADYKGAPTNGSAASPWTAGGDSSRHVVRGGSWKDAADKLTSSYRQGWPNELRDDAVGLRCVLIRQRSSK